MTDNDVLKKYADERQITEVWSRVMGYHRPVSQWNRGKQQEHTDRLYFDEQYTAY